MGFKNKFNTKGLISGVVKKTSTKVNKIKKNYSSKTGIKKASSKSGKINKGSNKGKKYNNGKTTSSGKTSGNKTTQTVGTTIQPINWHYDNTGAKQVNNASADKGKQYDYNTARNAIFNRLEARNGKKKTVWESTKAKAINKISTAALKVSDYSIAGASIPFTNSNKNKDYKPLLNPNRNHERVGDEKIEETVRRDHDNFSSQISDAAAQIKLHHQSDINNRERRIVGEAILDNSKKKIVNFGKKVAKHTFFNDTLAKKVSNNAYKGANYIVSGADKASSLSTTALGVIQNVAQRPAEVFGKETKSNQELIKDVINTIKKDNAKFDPERQEPTKEITSIINEVKSKKEKSVNKTDNTKSNKTTNVSQNNTTTTNNNNPNTLGKAHSITLVKNLFLDNPEMLKSFFADINSEADLKKAVSNNSTILKSINKYSNKGDIVNYVTDSLNSSIKKAMANRNVTDYHEFLTKYLDNDTLDEIIKNM